MSQYGVETVSSPIHWPHSAMHWLFSHISWDAVLPCQHFARMYSMGAQSETKNKPNIKKLEENKIYIVLLSLD